MLKKNLVKIFYLLLMLCNSNEILCIFPINLFKNWDINFRSPDILKNEKFELGAMTEGSLFISGRNSCKDKVNILQIWNKNQDALTMIRGFDQDCTEITEIIEKLNDVNDDGIRGHFDAKANLSAVGYYFFGRCFLPHDFTLNFFLPFYNMDLKNVEFSELTKSVNMADKKVRNYLTNDFYNLARNLGNLGFNGWNKSGIGDLVFFTEWTKNYPQAKPWLKNVHLDARVGLSLPTGKKIDEDELFSIPFGHDGAWGLLFGGGLDLTWGKYLRGGVDAEFLKLFGTSAIRRIKTDKDQTDLFLLAKTNVFKEIGINQRYNLYLEAYHFFKGFSFRIAYQYLKHGEDRFWLYNNQYSSSIANTAETLQGWTIHQFLFDLSYDLVDDLRCPIAVPKISLFYKLPFNGTRSVLAHTLGICFTLSF